MNPRGLGSLALISVGLKTSIIWSYDTRSAMLEYNVLPLLISALVATAAVLTTRHFSNNSEFSRRSELWRHRFDPCAQIVIFALFIILHEPSRP